MKKIYLHIGLPKPERLISQDAFGRHRTYFFRSGWYFSRAGSHSFCNDEDYPNIFIIDITKTELRDRVKELYNEVEGGTSPSFSARI